MNPLRAFLPAVFAACVIALSPDTLAQSARVSGNIRHAETGAPVRGAQVKIEGPALASRENSQIIRRASAQGGYDLEVPPGAYNVWVLADEFEDTKTTLNLTAGAKLERDFS